MHQFQIEPKHRFQDEPIHRFQDEPMNQLNMEPVKPVNQFPNNSRGPNIFAQFPPVDPLPLPRQHMVSSVFYNKILYILCFPVASSSRWNGRCDRRNTASPW